MFSPIVLVSDIDSGNLNLTSVCRAGGEDSTDNDFVDEPARRVESIVSEDTDNNDDGKNPIAEVTALLFYCNGVLVASTSTDCKGNF
jgi:hypothetical protein